MKKYIKTSIIVIGFIFCLSPINTKAENFAQKSEVIKQTTTNKELKNHIEDNKKLVKKYNKYVKRYKKVINNYLQFNTKKTIKYKFNKEKEYIIPIISVGTSYNKFEEKENPIEQDIIKTNKELLKKIKKIKKEIKRIKKEKQKFLENQTKNPNWKGSVLSKSAGVAIGPNGKETYYNLNMSGVIKTMRNLGNKDRYWIRKDGCKMLGDYIMVAANLKKYPRGSIVDTSLGKGIVCDTGGFVSNGSGVTFDIATDW